MYLNKKVTLSKGGLSIIIPVYNEEDNIYLLIKKIFFYNKSINFEVIIVDDNSADSTQLRVMQAIKRYSKKIKYFNRKEKVRDLSRSCQLGIKKSKYDNIIIMDGDLQHNPKYILNMMNLFNKKKLDVVVGARKFDIPSYLNTGQSYIRYIFSKILVLIINITFRKKTKDPMSGFFLFRKTLFTNNEKKLYLKGYKILVDILYSPMKNIKVDDYFIKFNKRNYGTSKMSLRVFFQLLIFYFVILKKILLKNIYNILNYKFSN